MVAQESGKEPAQKQSEQTQQFSIQRLYLDDLSYEAPGAPKIFSTDWKPELHLDLNTHTNTLPEDIYEVILTLTVTVKSKETTAFIVEVKYGGLFMIKGFNKEQLQQTLGSFCPNVLYPYAREVVSDIVQRGSFPQLVLAPINFDALYHQQLAQQEKKAAGGNGEETSGIS